MLFWMHSSNANGPNSTVIKKLARRTYGYLSMLGTRIPCCLMISTLLTLRSLSDMVEYTRNRFGNVSLGTTIRRRVHNPNRRRSWSVSSCAGLVIAR